MALAQIRLRRSSLFDVERSFERIRYFTKTYSGDEKKYKIEVKDFEQGPPVEAPVMIRITGDNLDTLEVQVEVNERIFSDEIKILQRMSRHIEKEIKDASVLKIYFDKGSAFDMR